MARLLALEADPARRRALTALVRDHLALEPVIVGSVAEAIAAIDHCAPDLILVPALLPPSDDEQLRAHLGGLDTAPYTQTLTLPALELLADTPAEAPQGGGLFGMVFNRRQAPPGPLYDGTLLAGQIAEGLRHAHHLRLEYAERLACHQAMEDRARGAALVLASGDDLPEISEATIQQQLRERAHHERRVAPRKSPGEVPWLAAVKLSQGPDLTLINISSTGVLVEAGSTFAPGATTHFHLCGPGTELVVPVRVVRSEVASRDGFGNRYRVAGAFATTIDLAGPQGETEHPPSRGSALADLFRSVLSQPPGAAGVAQQEFAQGLRQLIGARDVRIGPRLAAAASEVEFAIPCDDPSGRVLQVTFDERQEVTERQLQLLRASACLAAAILELESPVRTTARRDRLALAPDPRRTHSSSAAPGPSGSRSDVLDVQPLGATA
jgi:hypothetical protein